MPGFVDSTIKHVEDRLRELEDERSRLEAARLSLTGGRLRQGRPAGSSAPPASTPSPPRATKRRAAASSNGRRRNTRATQAVELVGKQPGITVPELAKAMGIKPNYLYHVLPRLAAEGSLKRDGQGWHPAT